LPRSDDHRERGELQRAIDLRIHRRRDADGGRSRDLLEAAPDGVFQAIGAVEVGGDQGRDAGQDSDNQEGDKKFPLKAASS